MYKFHIFNTGYERDTLSTIINNYPQLKSYEIEDGLLVLHSLGELALLQKELDHPIIISSPSSWGPYNGRADVLDLEIYDGWRE